MTSDPRHRGYTRLCACIAPQGRRGTRPSCRARSQSLPPHCRLGCLPGHRLPPCPFHRCWWVAGRSHCPNRMTQPPARSQANSLVLYLFGFPWPRPHPQGPCLPLVSISRPRARRKRDPDMAPWSKVGRGPWRAAPERCLGRPPNQRRWTTGPPCEHSCARWLVPRARPSPELGTPATRSHDGWRDWKRHRPAASQDLLDSIRCNCVKAEITLLPGGQEGRSHQHRPVGVSDRRPRRPKPSASPSGRLRQCRDPVPDPVVPLSLNFVHLAKPSDVLQETCWGCRSWPLCIARSRR
jgi:hypothetical protein